MGLPGVCVNFSEITERISTSRECIAIPFKRWNDQPFRRLREMAIPAAVSRHGQTSPALSRFCRHAVFTFDLLASVNGFTIPVLQLAYDLRASPVEAFMQKVSYRFNDEDRRVARRWRLASVGFYGSILGGLILYAALNQSPDLNLASAQSTILASQDNPRQR
jgi:hypothetical protein